MANETALNTQMYKSRIESYYTGVNAIPEINKQCQEMLEKPFNTDIFASQNNMDIGFDCYVHTFVQKLNDEQFEIFEQLGDDIRITLDDLCSDKNMKISDFKANLKLAKLNMIIFFYNIIYQKNNLFLPLKTGNYLMEHCYGITQCMKQEIYEMVVENTMMVNRNDVKHSLNKLLNDTEEFFTKSGLTNHRLYDALRKVYNLYWDIFYTTSNITP
jgi:hypothetical protein